MWYYVSKKNDTELEVLLGELADQLPSRGLDEYYGRLIIRMDAKESCEFTESLVYSWEEKERKEFLLAWRHL